MDFTQNTYRTLLQALQAQGFSFITFEEYMLQQSGRDFTFRQAQCPSHSDYTVILRHDVDLKPQNSLATAKLEHELDIKGSYYFRAVPESWNEEIIKEIVALGHEVGYHYETMDTVEGTHLPDCRFRQVGMTQIERLPAVTAVQAGINTDKYLRDIVLPSLPLTPKAMRRACRSEEYQPTPTRASQCADSPFRGSGGEGRQQETQNTERTNAHIDAAFSLFVQNLNRLRQIVDVKTICMHGSPRSKYDNKDIWQKYDYRKLGIIGEPYFDMDFNNFFYLTDTGRCWNGHRVSVRDKMPQQEHWNKQGLVFRTTTDIIKAANQGKLPPKIMITVHPQRWTNSATSWVKELVWQNVKNLVKKILISFR